MKTVFTFIIIFLISIITIISFTDNKSISVNSNLKTNIITINRSKKVKFSKNISLLTYNINRGVQPNGHSNINKIINIINKNKIDIVGLNEVDQLTMRSGFENQVKTIAKNTDMSYIYGPTLYTSFGKYGNALLSKYPILTAQNQRLPRINKNEPRGLIDATIKLPDNEQYHILVTHLSLDPQERRLQLNWIVNYANQLDKPYILMGDFNDNIEISNSFSIVNNIKTFPADNPRKQIDYIFSNINFKIINKKSLKTNVSDHLPLFVEFNTV